MTPLHVTARWDFLAQDQAGGRNLAIWHIWTIAAIVLFMAEIFTTGFLLGCIGIGCLVSSVVAYFAVGVKIQIAVFSGTTLLSFFVVRPLFVKYFYSASADIKTNVDALLGKSGLVSERIDPALNKGRVIVDGEDWRGTPVDDNVIEKGKKVTVVKVEGTKLYVKALPAQKEK